MQRINRASWRIIETIYFYGKRCEFISGFLSTILGHMNFVN
nr:MAG TPA: hypothetical protein [Caudoviricetes sp.]